MSPKQWLALLCFYISYLFFGASIFYTSEHRLETERRNIALKSRIEIHELLTSYTAPEDEIIQREIIDKISDYCEKPLTNYTEDKYVNPYVWNFYHSFFFSFTVCSTVGYGNISPNNTAGRMFMIFYALIGIPVNGILFAYLGEFFGKIFVRLYRRYKQYKISTNAEYAPKRYGLIAQIALYLIPGILIFIFLPASLFSFFEDWPYSISVYYAFVTLTTIGFGDYVVSFQPHQEREFGVFFVFYQIFIIIWFIFGVGYLVMIMGFLGRGLRSKKVAYLEHQLALNIKQTQSKIWNGVTKDIGYLRRMLNEIYMMKFKPVYHEPFEVKTNSHPRSESCPDLLIYRSSSPIPRRQRAFSESFGNNLAPCTLSSLTLNRAQSDTDLTKIDKKRTFEGVNAIVQPGELLARVVTALGNFKTSDEDGQSVLELAVNKGSGGIHGFSDDEILASERTWSGWSLPASEKSFNTPLKPRDRASSEIRIPVQHHLEDAHEWTWSGSNTQIKELMRLRQRSQSQKNDLYRASFGTDKIDRPFTVNIPPENIPSATNKTLLSRLNPFKKRTMSESQTRNSLAGDMYAPHNYLEATANGRTSRISLPKQYLNSTQKGRQSVYSQPEESSLLETTTIADLIRAIELVHTNAIRLDDTDNGSSPRRKMGTASLTPPRVPSLLTLFPQNYDSIGPQSFDKRRTSLRPTIYNSIKYPNKNRRQSSAVIGNYNSNSNSVSGMMPPTYFDSTPKLKRRFSVRPSSLLTPPGQAPSISSSTTTATSALQRKLSIRPSPLARQISLTNNEQTTRLPSSLWKPTQLQNTIINSRTRHGSLSNLYEKRVQQIDRQRTDSK